MAKKRIEIIAGINTYENLARFNSIEELNETVRGHKENLKGKLKRTHLAVLEVLHTHSAKYKGVSFMSKRKIGELIGKSRATVIRACKYLEEMGIIKQLEMKRSSDMRQTTNAILIQPVIEEDLKEENNKNATQEKTKMQHQENNIFLKQIHNIKHLNMTTASKRTPYVKLVPRQLQQYQAFFGTKIKQLYGRVWLAMKKLDVKVSQSIMQEIAHIAFDKLVEYIKQGRSLNNEQMNKIVYKIAYNQLNEREDTKSIVEHQRSVERALERLENVSIKQNETGIVQALHVHLNG